MDLGVYPLIDHFYEPLISRDQLDTGYRYTRSVPGIEWAIDEQWETIADFHWQDELLQLPLERSAEDKEQFYLLNGYFGPGDADLYYSLIRQLKPNTIIEIGSGHSTRLAAIALNQNATESSDSKGRITCVEPYRHADWFPLMGVHHISERIESLNRVLFESLKADDILFIDSSHVIRPQGDVLYLIQEILPTIPAGVYVHIHDIFSPLDYPNEWLVDRMHFWNEQYLLEAFLAFNSGFKVIASMQLLLATDAQRAERLLPTLHHRTSDIAATSLWLKRT